MKTCFFLGHRETTTAVWPELIAAVETHIVQYGVRRFFVGNYGNFDRLAVRAVRMAKENHSGITLFLLLPYHPTERTVQGLHEFDGFYYPMGMETVPRRAAIVRANQRMIDQVDFLIAYAWHPASNARNAVEYAKKREKAGRIRITNLYTAADG